MKRKFLFLLLAALLLVLTGCQLADPESGEESSDRLIGMLITTEYLDFWQDGPIEIPVKTTLTGQEPDFEAYQNSLRLYAEEVTTPMTGENGETIEHTSFEFPVDGVALYSAMTGEGENQYYTASSDKGMSDVNYNFYNLGTDGNREDLSMSGTVYATPSAEGREIYFNEIYQQADGRVYVTSGSGGFLLEAGTSEGAVFSKEISASAAVTLDGKTAETKTTVKVTLSVMNMPESITITEFGANGAVLSRTMYAPGQLPDEIVLKAGAAYLIVETVKEDPNGDTLTTRELIDGGAGTLTTFRAMDNGLCAAQNTALIWPD